MISFVFWLLVYSEFIFVITICPLQAEREKDNKCNGICPCAGSFHNNNGTSEIGSYSSERSFGSSNSWEAENMGALERAGMSRSDKESLKTEKMGNSKLRGMYSSTGASWAKGSLGAFGQQGLFSRKDAKGLNLYRTNTYDPSGVSWGSEYSGIFGREGLNGARGSSWKSGNTGGFGEIEILNAEGAVWKKGPTGAFGYGELLNKEDFLPGRGMHSSLGYAKMTGDLGKGGAKGTYAYVGLRGAINRAKAREDLSRADLQAKMAHGVAHGELDYNQLYGGAGYNGMHGNLMAKEAARDGLIQEYFNQAKAHQAFDQEIAARLRSKLAADVHAGFYDHNRSLEGEMAHYNEGSHSSNYSHSIDHSPDDHASYFSHSTEHRPGARLFSNNSYLDHPIHNFEDHNHMFFDKLKHEEELMKLN